MTSNVFVMLLAALAVFLPSCTGASSHGSDTHRTDDEGSANSGGVPAADASTSGDMNSSGGTGSVLVDGGHRDVRFELIDAEPGSDVGATSEGGQHDAGDSATDTAHPVDAQTPAEALCSTFCSRTFCGPPFTDPCRDDCMSDLAACSEAELEELQGCRDSCDLLWPCITAVACIGDQH